MYESIIKRLRDKQKAHMICGYELCGEAADAIEQLELEVSANETDRKYRIDENRKLVEAWQNALSDLANMKAERDKAYNRLCEWCGVCPADKRKPEFCEIANIGTVVNCKDCCADCQFIGCDRSGQCNIYVPKLKSRKVKT